MRYTHHEKRSNVPKPTPTNGGPLSQLKAERPVSPGCGSGPDALNSAFGCWRRGANLPAACGADAVGASTVSAALAADSSDCAVLATGSRTKVAKHEGEGAGGGDDAVVAAGGDRRRIVGSGDEGAAVVVGANGRRGVSSGGGDDDAAIAARGDRRDGDRVASARVDAAVSLASKFAMAACCCAVAIAWACVSCSRDAVSSALSFSISPRSCCSCALAAASLSAEAAAA